MDTKTLWNALFHSLIEHHQVMKVYCLNDAGALVEVTGTKVQIMRDEINVPIFILERD